MARYGGNFEGWAPYVPVAERRRQAARKVSDLKKKGKTLSPVLIEGRTIARTFWGKSWCDHLEAYSDFKNRLPRGKTYVRNGSVIDLQIGKGRVTALVSGSSIYQIEISIVELEVSRWRALIDQCAGKIDSLVELLQGKFSRGVMEVMTSQKLGLFPSPSQISMECSCPDSAVMCKHVAAVLYGIGTRLDEKPELFFELRNVDHSELISAAITKNTVQRTVSRERILKTSDLSGLFGVDLVGDLNEKISQVKFKKRPALKKNKTKKYNKKKGT